VTSPDYQQAVNVHSEHKEAARAWIDWFTDESGYAAADLALSPLKDAPLPDLLKPYEEAGVKLIDLDDSKGAEVKAIDNASEVGIYQPDYRQDLVDLARGAADGDLDSFFEGLSERWNEARETAGS
ncbi:carbohydrate ABC transporter substrate-binding protein, partial [Streptomyces sp. TRM76130]|nr:carbohydrate ABC transporter substrate-binding protein [Streptomyces sp. TRM76130]